MSLSPHALGLVLVALAMTRFTVLQPATLAQEQAAGPFAKWEPEIQAIEAAQKADPPAKGGVIFAGASSIRLWRTLATDFPQYKVSNTGFGGSQLAENTYFAPRIILPYQPRMIVIHAGGNDISSGKSPEQVLADFKAFVATVKAKLPDVKIAYLSINPTPARWAQREKQIKANQLIQQEIAGRAKDQLVFIDTWAPLLDEKGQPRPELHIEDKLHPNAAGYQIRRDIILPFLKP